MGRDEAIAKLKAHEAELKAMGVEHLYLFGSTLRGEAREDSDVDLFFDHPLGSLDLIQYIQIKDRTSAILGCKADVMSRRSIHRLIKRKVEAAAEQVF
jgi:predicted nucleotidyltransferase